MCGLSLVAASGGYSLVAVRGLLTLMVSTVSPGENGLASSLRAKWSAGQPRASGIWTVSWGRDSGE